MSLFRTIIVNEDNVDLARQLCALEAGGAGMLTTGLSIDGSEPATQFISSGECPPLIVQYCPLQTWEQEEDGTWVQTGAEPGNAQAVYDASQAADPPVQCTLLEIAVLFASADITQQDPWVALNRLGLQLVQTQDL